MTPEQHIHYLKDMYNDPYFPPFLVDKVKVQLEEVVTFLEKGVPSIAEVQAKLDEITLAINDLQEDFGEHDSEIETVARESIAHTLEEILNYYKVEIDIETAIQKRDW